MYTYFCPSCFRLAALGISISFHSEASNIPPPPPLGFYIDPRPTSWDGSASLRRRHPESPPLASHYWLIGFLLQFRCLFSLAFSSVSFLQTWQVVDVCLALSWWILHMPADYKHMLLVNVISIAGHIYWLKGMHTYPEMSDAYPSLSRIPIFHDAKKYTQKSREKNRHPARHLLYSRCCENTAASKKNHSYNDAIIFFACWA